MNHSITPAPVKKSLAVAATPERAFDAFTRRFDAWWPRSHSIGASPLQTAVLEPRAGGRWFGRLQDGTEADWGEVLVWDAPRRLLLAWRIGADWRYRPDLLTEVEVTFTPTADGTQVTLEHRLLENMGAAGEGARAAFDSEGGWGLLLRLYGELVGSLEEEKTP
ncbi:MAG TPA: SRPBCC family protein [Caulobacteraceae bacterium]|nr:SRPBCC family protein [Caulobacteraceae bacterium]